MIDGRSISFCKARSNGPRRYTKSPLASTVALPIQPVSEAERQRWPGMNYHGSTVPRGSDSDVPA